MSSDPPISPLALYRNSCLQRQLNVQLKIYDKDMKASRRRLDSTRNECKDQLRILRSERRAYLLENAIKKLKLMEEMGCQRANTAGQISFKQSLQQRNMSKEQPSPTKRRPASTKITTNGSESKETKDRAPCQPVRQRSTLVQCTSFLRPLTSRGEYISTGNSHSNFTDDGSSTITNESLVGDLTALQEGKVCAQPHKPRPSTAWEAGTKQTNTGIIPNVHFKETTEALTNTNGNDTNRGGVIPSSRTFTFSRDSLPYRYEQPGIRRPHSAPVGTMYNASNKRFTGISKKEKAGIKAEMEKHVQHTKELVQKSKRLKKYIRKVTGMEDQEEDVT